MINLRVEGKLFQDGTFISVRLNRPTSQCYFGEHLLRDNAKPVAIVEGESTAVVCSAIWPQYIWIATGGNTGGKWYDPDRLSVLRGREVVMWPDSGKYEEWRHRAQPLRKIVKSLMVSH